MQDFVEESNTWYLWENQEFHDVRFIKCRREILAKKGPNGFVMGYRKPIYVCSGRAEGCKAVYCGDCWGEVVVCLKQSRRQLSGRYGKWPAGIIWGQGWKGEGM